MAVNDVQHNDSGTTVRMTVYHGTDILDISQATKKEIRLKPKNGLRIDKEANFTTSGSDGKMECIVSGSDFGTVGELSLQGYLEFPEGNWYTNVKTITVNKNL